MLAIAQKLGFPDLKSFRASLKTNPKLHPASAEALLDAYRGYLKPMQAKLPELFGTLPKAPFEVVPVPDYLEKNSPPAYYQAGTPDGSRPGRLFIDTYNATDRNLYAVEVDRLPRGHSRPSPADLHRAGADGRAGVPQIQPLHGLRGGMGTLRRAAGQGRWLLPGPLLRLRPPGGRYLARHPPGGRYRRAQSQHWTREQMVEYFHDHSNIDETSVQAEVDRYIAWPSQALAYKIGAVEDSGTARPRAKSLWARSSTYAPSTTRCWTPAHCRSTCWSSASTRGSRDRRRAAQ